MFARPPLIVVLPIPPAEKESPSGVGSGLGGLVAGQPSHPRLAVVRKRLTDATSRDDEICRVEIAHAYNAVHEQHGGFSTSTGLR